MHIFIYFILFCLFLARGSIFSVGDIISGNLAFENSRGDEGAYPWIVCHTHEVAHLNSQEGGT